jgi:lysyl-tRNA synthetase class 2
LNDPQEQQQRLARQREDLRSIHEYDNEDPDFIDALSLGMPPLSGIGLGIDRFLMLLLSEQNIREVIPFPYAMLRP